LTGFQMTLDIVPPPSSMHSVLIKCFADEDALHYTDHESRKPFKELRVIAQLKTSAYSSHFVCREFGRLNNCERAAR
jgi:hypothetical protein